MCVCTTWAMTQTLQGSKLGREPGLAMPEPSPPTAPRGAGVTPLVQVHCGKKGKGQAGSAAKIRSSARGGFPPGSEAAFQANPFSLSALHCWLWEGYPALPQLRSTGKMSAS